MSTRFGTEYCCSQKTFRFPRGTERSLHRGLQSIDPDKVVPIVLGMKSARNFTSCFDKHDDEANRVSAGRCAGFSRGRAVVRK